MKRIMLPVLLAAMLVFGIAGNASAYFETGNAFAVFYADGDNEVAIDLGVLTPGSGITLDAPDLSMFTAAITSYNQINVGIFAAEAGYSNWFATTTMDTPSVSGSSIVSFTSGAGTLASTFAGADADNDGMAVLEKSGTTGTYHQVMNSNGTAPGYYAGFNPNFQLGEATLDAVGAFTMYLHNFDITTADPAAMVSVNAAPVPVPAAVWLLGSGLIGLIGIRRKNA